MDDDQLEVSATIITLNEADRIRDALESVAFAKERIVVDGGSTDGTCDIARALGATVLQRPFDGFGAQKQFALEQARFEWVLALDADERVSPELAAEIHRRVAAAPGATAGFLCPRRNHYLGRRIRHAGWSPDLKLRLVRRVRARWTGDPVHEALVVDGDVERLEGAIVHVSHRGLADHLRKIALYSRLWAGAARGRGRRARWVDLVLRPLHHVFKRYLLHQGFRDGLPGLVLCLMGAFHVFFKYACLFERQLQDGTPRGERDED